MKNPLDLVRSRLLADPAIAAVVGERIYLLAVPQGSPTPSILLIPLDGDAEDATLDADYLSTEHRIAVDCRADTVAAAGALGDLVIDRLAGFGGAIDGVAVDRIEFDGGGEYIFDDATKTAHHVLDFYLTIGG